MPADAPLLEVADVTKEFVSGLLTERRTLAVDGVSFSVLPGEVFGVVGESGSGKTTLARILLKVLEPDSGRVLFGGRDLRALRRYSEVQGFRRRVQAIVQGCEEALSPRMRIRESLREVFRVHGRAAYRAVTEDRLAAMLAEVGLHSEHLDRYPLQLSGGQLQRVMIARVMAVEPQLIIADEPTSSLDVSVQAQIIRLLLDLKRRRDFTMVMISHDIELMKAVADRIVVMRDGRIIESGTVDAVANAPRQEYTRRLLAAAGRATV